MKPPSENNEMGSSLIWSSTKEDNATASSCCWIIIMAAGVYSPKTSQTYLSFDDGNEHEGMPLMDVSNQLPDTPIWKLG